ncbi:hypothetical protein BpHYR1_049668 [Brachionus plicatilis]|uniref:Uncharacterized protein n=1 Tax=Brachionus plicatilis TaxID=10195 RepID=A0A3M7R6A3_BRAPC|nr:hypothetical protein BpHYR1_049668 [Brachionus plicatilis]
MELLRLHRQTKNHHHFQYYSIYFVLSIGKKDKLALKKNYLHNSYLVILTPLASKYELDAFKQLSSGQ